MGLMKAEMGEWNVFHKSWHWNHSKSISHCSPWPLGGPGHSRDSEQTEINDSVHSHRKTVSQNSLEDWRGGSRDRIEGRRRTQGKPVAGKIVCVCQRWGWGGRGASLPPLEEFESVCCAWQWFKAPVPWHPPSLPPCDRLHTQVFGQGT